MDEKLDNKIHLRSAILSDLPLLVHWCNQSHVIAAGVDEDWQWETELQKNPEWREQLIAELDGRPIGYIEIIDPALEEEHYWGEMSENFRAIDIWIGEKEDLGKGHGTEMMNLAIERCFKDSKVKAIIIDPLTSNKRAQQFYERLGFKFIERRQFGDDDCSVYQLNRKDWKKE